MKKSFIYCLVVAMVFILLSIGSILIIYGGQKYKENDSNNIVTEEKTIEEQTVEVLALDENDKNVIGYISIEKIGLDATTINSNKIQQIRIKDELYNLGRTQIE